MFNIRNYDDLRLAYMILELDAEHGERRKEHADNLKRKMRKFCNAPLSEKRIVSDNGIDGYIVLYPLPEYIQTAEEAKEYFNQYEYIEMTYSAYDCTGKAFTSWYKIFNRNNRFFVYHSIGFDV